MDSLPTELSGKLTYLLSEEKEKDMEMLRGSGSHPRADRVGRFSLQEQRDPGGESRPGGGGVTEETGRCGELSLDRKCRRAPRCPGFSPEHCHGSVLDSQRPGRLHPRAPPLLPRLETPAHHTGLRVHVTSSRKPALLAPCRPIHFQRHHLPLLGGTGEIDYWRSHSSSGWVLAISSAVGLPSGHTIRF